jgi:hypothetical protein
MSFDLAVWEGPRPRTDSEAQSEFKRLTASPVGAGPSGPPGDKIRAFIAAITAVYPDITDLPDDEVDDGVWSDGPLLGNARGPFFYFGIVWSRVEEVAPVVANPATKHGLVCFDPQRGRCVPSWGG